MVWREASNIHSYYLRPTGKRIIATTLLLSTVIHIISILYLPGIFSLAGLGVKPRAYKVDLIRPPMDEINQDSKQETARVSQIHSEPALEVKEATISLDTKDSTYSPYATVIKERIFSYWVYPLSAQQNLMQGSLLIVFRLDRDGNLMASTIARSSGHTILDEHALNAVRSADPFPPFPEVLPVQFLNINASFIYRLSREQ